MRPWDVVRATSASCAEVPFESPLGALVLSANGGGMYGSALCICRRQSVAFTVSCCTVLYGVARCCTVLVKHLVTIHDRFIHDTRPSFINWTASLLDSRAPRTLWLIGSHHLLGLRSPSTHHQSRPRNRRRDNACAPIDRNRPLAHIPLGVHARLEQLGACCGSSADGTRRHRTRWRSGGLS